MNTLNIFFIILYFFIIFSFSIIFLLLLYLDKKINKLEREVSRLQH